MTLKRQLDDAHSLVRSFFSEHLCNTKSLRVLLRPALAGPIKIVPPAHPMPYPASEVGHAFGVRCGLSFSPEVAAASRPRLVGNLGPECVDSFHSSFVEMLTRLAPQDRCPARADERILARYSYALGLFDQQRRVGSLPGMPLLQLSRAASSADLLALCPKECVEDLCDLAEAADRALAGLPRSPAIVGPTFTGSPDVGGADADLIVGRCLVEVKTTKQSAATQHVMQEVISYALLDYEDKYAIEEVAIYSARHAALARVPLQDALDALAGRPTDRAELRATLARFLGTR